MHDIVAHGLLVMVRLSDAAVAKLPGDPAQSSSAMMQVSATGREALADMRQLLGVLGTDSMGTARQPQPGLGDLDALFEKVRATGLNLDTTVTGEPTSLGRGVELVVYRAVQEALTNVLKHADRPTCVRVAVTYGPEETTVEVEDDGTAQPAESIRRPSDRRGLAGMTERVAAYGGLVNAAPGPVRGWRLRATVPTPKRQP